MSVEINALESARFGITAARLTDPFAPLAQVNAAARTMNVQMMTVRVDSTDLRRVQELEDDGYRLMDTLVWYGRELVDLPEIGPSPADEIIRRAGPEDAAKVATVAQEAFAGYCGHYHSDPRLSAAAADAAYVDWAESSVARCTDSRPVLVAVAQDRIVGFLTLDLEAAEIVLNAVIPGEQGKGTYGRLIDRALETGRKAGLTRLAVSTQLNNLAPQRAWVRRGFRMQRSLHTLHKWF